MNVIRWHLSGKDVSGRDFVAGVYPMLCDETTFFLAADFDKADWLDDSRRRLGHMPSPQRTGRAGTIAVRQWRSCLVVF